MDFAQKILTLRLTLITAFGLLTFTSVRDGSQRCYVPANGGRRDIAKLSRARRSSLVIGASFRSSITHPLTLSTPPRSRGQARTTANYRDDG